MTKIKPLKKIAHEEHLSGVPSALTILNALPDAVVGFNAGLRVGFSNHAAQSLFCFSEKQFLGKDMASLLGEENAVFATVETGVRKNLSVTLHDVNVKGKAVSSVTISPVERDAWYLLAIRQHSMQSSGEWGVQTKYSLQSTERVAQMLAHEIKNPLAGIRGAAQLLDQSKLSREDRELANLIERETLRIQGLVDKFNIFHEVPQSQYSLINLHEVLDRVIKVAQAAYGDAVEIRKDFDPSLPDIRGYFDHLVQAKLNLVKNAVEAFGGKKGRVSIRTYYDNAAAYHPERPEKLPLCVEIEDNSEGIPPEALSRIFQPYFTTKPEGQGLGLPIVSKIIDNHGGIIHVDSTPGRTIFKISLPLPADAGKE